MRLVFAGLPVAAALFALSQPAAAQPVETAQGPVEVTSADRVAVMDIAAIDTLAALGVAPAGVPDKLYVGYLDSVAANAAPVGTLFEPDLEKLAALSPDLIVVGGRSVAQKEAVSQVAPVIDMTIGTDVVADARARITTYGALFGKADKAAELAAALDEKLAKAKAAGAGKGTALVLMTNGPKMSAYGKGSRFGWVFDATGLTEAAPDLKVDTHGAAISHEFIAQVNPDWLIVIDRGVAVGEEGQSAKATLDTPLVGQTKAWQAGHVIYLDSAAQYIAGGGYQSTTQALDQLTEALSK